MAKSARVTVEPTEDSDVARDAERMADLNESEGGELFRAIEEARATQGAEVILTRTMPADRAGFCDKIPVAEFDLSLLKSKYGPGTYRVRFNGPTGFLPGGSTIKVAPAPEKPAGTASGDLGALLAMMEQRDAERRRESEARSSKVWDLALASVPALIAGFFSRPQPAGTDVAALVTALKPAPGPGLTELTAALANMRTLSEPKNTDSKVDEILKIIESVQQLGGDKEDKGGSSWIDIVRDLIKVAPDALKPVLEARMRAMQAGAVSASVQPAPGPAAVSAPRPVAVPPVAPPSVGNAANNGGADMMLLLIPWARTNLAKVADWAEQSRDPQLYADVLFDELPDNFGTYLSVADAINYLNHPQWFEKICEIEPRLMSHREWCDVCRVTIIEIMKDLQEPEEPKTPAPTGDDATVNTSD